ncbi:MAG: DUF3667 domain-containing protein [Burkholderiales bacterium]
MSAENALDLAPPRCANCDASLAIEPPPRHCPQCGQLLRPMRPREFMRDAVARYGRTLVALIMRPGLLTREFIAGRRERYVAPLRLYLAASFLFFLVVKGLGFAAEAHIVIAPAIDVHGKAITATSDPAAFAAEIAKAHACVDQPGSCSWSRTLQSRWAIKGAAEAEHPNAVAGRMLGMAPNAVFVLLPIFAALVMLAYWRRRLRYSTHLVFSLHMHAFWFLALLPIWQLPGDAALVGVLALIGHGGWSLQRVYGGAWWATLLRALGIAFVYTLALSFTMAGLGIASVVLN